MIPVIDIFAGPGGLGEGFASLRDSKGDYPFEVSLSIEKDKYAWETLRLRSLFRLYEDGRAPDEYYEFLRGELSREDIYSEFKEDFRCVDKMAILAELGSTDWPRKRVNSFIRAALGRYKNFVLIGGPPCQAYSVVGRSRNRGNAEYDPETDVRNTLYIEYLQILADHQPCVFVMENVKGLLSAKVSDQLLFQKLLSDLSAPAKALRTRKPKLSRSDGRQGYKLFSLIEPGEYHPSKPKNFVIAGEHYGVPQARHRVIILGIREDLAFTEPDQLIRTDQVGVMRVIGDLPAIRSGLSREFDSRENWEAVLSSVNQQEWFLNGEMKSKGGTRTKRLLAEVIRDIGSKKLNRGSEFMRSSQRRIQWKREWFYDSRIGGVCNHVSKAHMVSDIHRYIYAACYAQIHGVSPQLKNFPLELLPDHQNVSRALGHDNFSDRFRVQVADKPASTITSHIRKDGHYFIHPDPIQARSLTVREAARIQTFPDNYYFCGSRTQQYKQVGNAVPPLLARQIAEVVLGVLKRSKVIR